MSWALRWVTAACPAGALGQLGVYPVLPAIAFGGGDVVHGSPRDLDGIHTLDLAGGELADDLWAAQALVQTESSNRLADGLGVLWRESHGWIVPRGSG